MLPSLDGVNQKTCLSWVRKHLIITTDLHLFKRVNRKYHINSCSSLFERAAGAKLLATSSLKRDPPLTNPKVYNKVVSQFEAREVLETFGGHAADFVDCSNKHLRRIFEHQEVLERGCTRIEASHYRGVALSAEDSEELVAGALPRGAGGRSGGSRKRAFCGTATSKAVAKFSKHLYRCFLRADRPQNKL